MFSKSEISILKKYKNSRILDSEDKNTVRAASLIGFVKYGIMFSRGRVVQTASLTKRGIRFLKETKIKFL